ncbi:hypothetical protein HO173_005410 [Letharia columbiana]|uniref:Uncharacterized protein n=1 Tax=Letharia columbiana TaxID=112416 RepID=A0A8H6L5R1_9LECA|nr:uncharacterized protein HO173_005410 [Letharia columbiana]KAF6236629.1 hypothetical protein HO173_005410 [Letharia columbiana]
MLQTNPYPKPLRNIVKTLDRVIAAAEGPGNYRMSMEFVRQRQFRSDAIIVWPCEEEHGPSAAGPQAQDASMMDLAALSFDETWWAHVLRSWGIWPE